jgi:hypothetical protein
MMQSGDYQTIERMAQKQRAVKLPDFKGKNILDVGCDHGFWCWLAAERGAAIAVGLDRNRPVNGKIIDLIDRNNKIADAKKLKCLFIKMDIGRQWRQFTEFDITLMMSLYHHVFENCGDHSPIWYWLRKHTCEVLIWENPVGINDDVVRLNMSPENQANYSRDAILSAAEKYFIIERIGPALHSPTREVWHCHPKPMQVMAWVGKTEKGQGGATRAFEYADGRRIKEIEFALSIKPYPGSLNIRLNEAFTWDRNYYRVKISDPVERNNLNGEWASRWARFYPVKVNEIDCFAFRFENERYDDNFVELISPMHLRTMIGNDVTLCA